MSKILKSVEEFNGSLELLLGRPENDDELFALVESIRNDYIDAIGEVDSYRTRYENMTKIKINEFMGKTDEGVEDASETTSNMNVGETEDVVVDEGDNEEISVDDIIEEVKI